jgi:hypothetical protein
MAGNSEETFSIVYQVRAEAREIQQAKCRAKCKERHSNSPLTFDILRYSGKIIRREKIYAK